MFISTIASDFDCVIVFRPMGMWGWIYLLVPWNCHPILRSEGVRFGKTLRQCWHAIVHIGKLLRSGSAKFDSYWPFCLARSVERIST